MIGRRAKRVSPADAMDHVAGYVVVNDVSARDWQGDAGRAPRRREGRRPVAARQGLATRSCRWVRCSSRADELDPRAGLRLRSWRITPDGTEHLMQDGTTADMIWDVPALIEPTSREAITLEPGDVIATGTPAGVGVFRDPPVFLEPGDRVRCEIEGIGTRREPGRRLVGGRRRPGSTAPDRCRAPRDASRYAPCMQALVKTAPGPGLELLDVPEPSMTINDVRIRVRKTGICGTDLHIADWEPGRSGRSSRRSSSGTSSSARCSRSAATSTTSRPATSSAARATSSAVDAAIAAPVDGTCAPTRSASASSATGRSPSRSSCR